MTPSPQLQRGAEHLHRLGPRAIGEALAEIGLRSGDMTTAFAVVVEYQERLTPEKIRSAGADRFPPPLSIVP
jgi:hypothetical protein